MFGPLRLLQRHQMVQQDSCVIGARTLEEKHGHADLSSVRPLLELHLLPILARYHESGMSCSARVQIVWQLTFALLRAFRAREPCAVRKAPSCHKYGQLRTAPRLQCTRKTATLQYPTAARMSGGPRHAGGSRSALSKMPQSFLRIDTQLVYPFL